ALLMQKQVDSERVDFRQEAGEILQAAAEAVDAPRHDHIEFSPRGGAAQRVEGRALVAVLGTADAVILVDFDNLAAHAAGDLAQLALLVGRGLIEGRDAKVENSTLHHAASPPSLFS